MQKFKIILLLLAIFTISSCENREVNEDHSDEEGNTFNDMPVDGIETHFNRITVDGSEYLILERDRNNPHEGFGFMAFRPNKLLRKQDTIMAYLQTVIHSQAEILSLLKKTTPEQEKEVLMKLYEQNLSTRKPIMP